MQVILHVGALCTDEDRLITSLMRNSEEWRNEGIVLPPPEHYRSLLSQSLTELAQHTAAADAREVLLDSILADEPDATQIDRMVLSHPTIFGVPKLMFAGGMFFRRAEDRLLSLRALFARDDVEIFIGLRDPATFLPAAFHEAPQTSTAEFLQGFDPMEFYWSQFLTRLRTALPDVPITVWSNEDTPLLWGELLRRLGGVTLDRKVTGAFDLFSEIVSKEGMRRFRTFLKENPTLNEAQKRRVMVAIMGKYAVDDAMVEELDMPGWTQDRVSLMSHRYDQDLARIERIPGVYMVSP